MTNMHAQDQRARRRRARWGPEAGEEPQVSAAAQPLQAAPSRQAIAGEDHMVWISLLPLTCNLIVELRICPADNCHTLPQRHGHTAFPSSFASCSSTCLTAEREDILGWSFSRSRGGCCGRINRSSAGCQHRTLQRSHCRIKCGPQEAACWAHTLGARGQRHS